MKKDNSAKYKSTHLSDDSSAFSGPVAPKQKEVVSITANVCEEKNLCSGCDRGKAYGIPLMFVLHYGDSSINTVCYRCGARAARAEGLKLPLTEPEIYRKIMKREGV